MNAVNFPDDSESTPAPRSAFLRFLARAQAFTFSTLIHAIIIILVGGSVLLKVQEDAPDFVSEGGGLVNPEVLKIATPE